ncbi:MAG TPA: signal peptidase II [Patescibacteria group bacterium]|nr:signal peptidase II [Patescibacteria group bacterium]
MKNKLFVYCLLLAVLLFVDQITKAIFANRDFYFLGMHFHLVKNYGLSFGLNFGNALDLGIIVAALVAFLVYLFVNSSSGKINYGVLLVVAGAAGNLIDRLRLGFVRDFWDIRLGFTFNFADALIFIGLLMLLFGKDYSKTSPNADSNTDAMRQMPQN